MSSESLNRGFTPDELPVTFRVRATLNEATCEVRGRTLWWVPVSAAGYLLALLVGFGGLALLPHIWVDGGPGALADAAFVVGITLVLAFIPALLGSPFFVYRRRARWLLPGLALSVVPLSVLADPPVAVGIAMVGVCADLGLAIWPMVRGHVSKTHIRIEPHGVELTQNGTAVRLPAEGLVARTDGAVVLANDVQIPMHAHPQWEREWLRDRFLDIARAPASTRTPASLRALVEEGR
jgi:hypothetical protein